MINYWSHIDSGVIDFKEDIFFIKRISNRLFVFTKKAVYEIVENKKGGLKKKKINVLNH